MPTREDAERLAQDLMARWSFRPVCELPGGWCSVVYADEHRVLKVPFQGEEMTTGYFAAVRLNEAGIAPHIHQACSESGSILMDRISPGTSLAKFGLDDELAMPVFLDLAKVARTCDPSGLMTLREYYEPASARVEALIESTETNVFLHGDLHHGNILEGSEGWRTIDAKGLVGDPAFEAVAFLRNPIHLLGEVENMADWLRERILKIAQGLDVPPARVWAWSLADREYDPNPDPNDPWTRMLEALHQLETAFTHTIG